MSSQATTLTCSKCGEEKPTDEFYVDRTRGRLCQPCKECCRIRARANYAKTDKDRNAAVQRAWKAANREHVRAYKASKRLGVPIEEVHAVLAQDACQICGRSDVQLCIDHCHETGAVRGMLCHSCNRGIGNFYDDTARLRAAIEYLTTDKEAT